MTLLAIVMMFGGALTFWLKGWSFTFIAALFLVLNILVKQGVLQQDYAAFGMDYSAPPVPYNLGTLEEAIDTALTNQDKAATLAILENWRAKFPATEPHPKMVFICTSGGGQRSALWSVRALQMADSLTGGALMKHTQLITGASGGLVGAAYYRELVLRRNLGEPVNPWDSTYLDLVAKDALNPILLTMVVNDLFYRFPRTIDGRRYRSDRGLAFEKQFNRNTQGVLNRKLKDYGPYEAQSLVPMMLLAPTIINDGRKLYISPQHVSYMNTAPGYYGHHLVKTKGIDFLRYFEGQDSENLRWLTALRMSATFPYITPNIKLPSKPTLEIMDAGVSDNFGVSDAIRFLYNFQGWINTNTSGVVFLIVRDSEKNEPVERRPELSLMQKMFSPIGALSNNLTEMQDIVNDNLIEFAHEWYPGPMYTVELQYLTRSAFEKEDMDLESFPELLQQERASLSWRLTTSEKANIRGNIQLPVNQDALARLRVLLGPAPTVPIPLATGPPP